MNDNAIIPLAEKRSTEKAKGFASLHCKHFRRCLDKASKDDVEMGCSTCEMIEVVRNRYMDELVDDYLNKDCDRYPMHLPTNKGVRHA